MFHIYDQINIIFILILILPISGEEVCKKCNCGENSINCTSRMLHWMPWVSTNVTTENIKRYVPNLTNMFIKALLFYMVIYVSLLNFQMHICLSILSMFSENCSFQIINFHQKNVDKESYKSCDCHALTTIIIGQAKPMQGQ